MTRSDTQTAQFHELAATSLVGSALRLNTLDRLSAHTQRVLARIGISRLWRDGDVILRLNDVLPWAVNVAEGQVRISTVTEQGMEQVRRWRGTGEIFGLAPLLTCEPVGFHITASGACRTILYPAEDLLRGMRTDAVFALDIAMLLARKVQELSQMKAEEQNSSLESRVHAALLVLARADAMPNPTKDQMLKISQHEMAAMVGSSRQHVNVVLKSLERKGVLKLGYRSIMLCGGSVTS